MLLRYLKKIFYNSVAELRINIHYQNLLLKRDGKSYCDHKNPHSVSVNKRNTELTTDDKILVLSTCLNSGDGRYLVHTHIILLKGCNRKRLQPFVLDRNIGSIYTIININEKY